MAVPGERAIELLRELKASPYLTQFDEAGVREVLTEIEELYQNLLDVLHAEDISPEEDEVASNLVFHHASILRNKRCLLAYLSERRQQLEELRWEFGPALTQDVQKKCAPAELEYFREYDKILSDYQRDCFIDVTANRRPPKDLYIQVRVKRTYGELYTEGGQTVNLRKGTTHYLRRTDVESLIRQGVLEHVAI